MNEESSIREGARVLSNHWTPLSGSWTGVSKKPVFGCPTIGQRCPNNGQLAVQWLDTI
jgi:hypothetical protein